MEADNSDKVKTVNVIYSDYWTRLGASVIDIIILIIPYLALYLYNMFYLKNFTFIALVLFVMTLYKPLLEYYYGATWGKMIMKIKVVDAKNEMISIAQAFIRSLPGIFGLITGIYGAYVMHSNEGFLYANGLWETSEWMAEDPPTGLAAYGDYFAMLALLISSLFIFWESKRQAFHDKLAQTFVIKDIQ